MERPNLDEWLKMTPEQIEKMSEEADKEIKEHPMSQEEMDIEEHEHGYFEGDEDDEDDEE